MKDILPTAWKGVKNVASSIFGSVPDKLQSAFGPSTAASDDARLMARRQYDPMNETPKAPIPPPTAPAPPPVIPPIAKPPVETEAEKARKRTASRGSAPYVPQ